MSREGKFALGDRLLALLFPERCLFCRKPVDAGQCFCSACEKKVPIAPLARRLEAAVPGGAGFSCRSPLSY
ncbi:MAG: double zinc ribbon domain-containing protein, partial [Neglectibacter timonensis]